MRDLDASYLPALRDGFAALEAEGRAWLAAQGYDGDVDLRLSAEMRYAGQSFEIDVPLEPDWLVSADAIADAFHRSHLAVYDFEDRTGAIEVVNIRLSVLGAGVASHLNDHPPVQSEPPRTIRAYAGHWHDVPLYRREGLAPGFCFDGPAIVAQEDTTFVIPGGATACVDPHLNIVLDLGGEP